MSLQPDVGVPATDTNSEDDTLASLVNARPDDEDEVTHHITPFCFLASPLLTPLGLCLAHIPRR